MIFFVFNDILEVNYICNCVYYQLNHDFLM